MLAAMTRMTLLLPFVIAACSSGPSKQDATRLFGAAGVAMTSAQASAVSAAQGHHALVAAAQVSADYSGPCALGGTAGVTGNYDDSSGSGSNAAFDMTVTFNACHGVAGTLDGSVHWTSTATSSGFSAAMNGNLSWTDGTDSASCGIDVKLALTATSISYTGSVCGYDVQTDLHM